MYGDIKLKIAPGTQNDEKQKISKYGVQKLPPNASQKGDHFVTIKVIIPKRLSKEQLRAMTAYAKIEPKTQTSSA